MIHFDVLWVAIQEYCAHNLCRAPPLFHMIVFFFFCRVVNNKRLERQFRLWFLLTTTTTARTQKWHRKKYPWLRHQKKGEANHWWGSLKLYNFLSLSLSFASSLALFAQRSPVIIILKQGFLGLEIYTRKFLWKTIEATHLCQLKWMNGCHLHRMLHNRPYEIVVAVVVVG